MHECDTHINQAERQPSRLPRNPFLPIVPQLPESAAIDASSLTILMQSPRSQGHFPSIASKELRMLRDRDGSLFLSGWNIAVTSGVVAGQILRGERGLVGLLKVKFRHGLAQSASRYHT